MPMHPEASAAFLVEVARWEGRIPWMYLDHKGYVTTGVGNLIDPVALALDLQWLRRDGEPAGPGEIRDEWDRVKAMKAGMFAKRYRHERGLHLAPATIDDLVVSKREEFWEKLTGHLPELTTAPAPAQLAALLMAWALGPHFPPRWPKFSATVRAGDWMTAAAECLISGARPERNAHHAELFRLAAGEAGQ